METSHKSPTSRTSLKSKQIPRRSHNPHFLKRTTRKGINRLRYRHRCQRVKHLQRRANRATPNLKTHRQLQTTKSKQLLRRRDSLKFCRKMMREGINRFRYRLPCQRTKHLQRRAKRATPNLKTRRRLQTTICRIARLRPLVLRISENRLNRRGRSKKGRGKRASRLNSNKSQTKIRKRPTNPLSSRTKI